MPPEGVSKPHGEIVSTIEGWQRSPAGRTHLSRCGDITVDPAAPTLLNVTSTKIICYNVDPEAQPGDTLSRNRWHHHCVLDHYRGVFTDFMGAECQN